MMEVVDHHRPQEGRRNPSLEAAFPGRDSDQLIPDLSCNLSTFQVGYCPLDSIWRNSKPFQSCFHGLICYPVKSSFNINEDSG
ncbi:hypothetical protein J6590_075023 [Homalodisca vitripennis]|nr:hypothetical protein J6590_075023 [Homalodisca vitripennis]